MGISMAVSSAVQRKNRADSKPYHAQKLIGRQRKKKDNPLNRAIFLLFWNSCVKEL